MLDLDINTEKMITETLTIDNKRLELRKLTENNIEECLNIFEDVYKNQALKNYPELVEQFKDDNRNNIERIKDELNSETMSGTVIYENDNIIGFILVSEPNYIRKIGIVPEYQNKGIGTELINTTNKDNKELVVHAAEAAIDFYKKNGFVADGMMNRDKYPYLPMRKIL